MGSLISRTLLAWCCILALAIVNGGLREKFVRRRFGDFGAELVGAAVLSAGCLVAALWVMHAAGPQWESTALRVGTSWVLMTLAFEFGFFHYVAGKPWSELLAAYRIWEGRLWVVVLISIFVAPFVAAWLHARG